MIDLHLSVPPEVVEEVDALAKECSQSRSDLVLRVLRLERKMTTCVAPSAACGPRDDARAM